MEDLKSCPFCGGDASIGDSGDYHFVNCAECLATTNLLTIDAMQYTKEEAAERWNTRPESAELLTLQDRYNAQEKVNQALIDALKANDEYLKHFISITNETILGEKSFNALVALSAQTEAALLAAGE